jgi:uncharacterized caspase-like protein
MRRMILALATAWLLCPGPAWADRRVALVIGNGAYQHADRLANPVTDARNLRDALKKIGFAEADIVYGEDLDKRDLERALGRFASIARGADVALAYYAGHGATFGDTPYLVPVDARFDSLDQMPYELAPLEAMVGELRKAKGVRIAIVDACRDNAAERDLKRQDARGGEITRGLAPPRNPDGLIVAYATQYLSTAADGPVGGDSPFTSALLKHLPTPGLDVKDLFFEVGREVLAATHGRQRPEVKVSFYDKYALVPPKDAPISAPAQPASPPAIAQDELVWSAIEGSSDAKLFEQFIARFPTSPLRARAKEALDNVRRSQTAAIPATPLTEAPKPGRQSSWLGNLFGASPDNQPTPPKQTAALAPMPSLPLQDDRKACVKLIQDFHETSLRRYADTLQDSNAGIQSEQLEAFRSAQAKREEIDLELAGLTKQARNAKPNDKSSILDTRLRLERMSQSIADDLDRKMHELAARQQEVALKFKAEMADAQMRHDNLKERLREAVRQGKCKKDEVDAALAEAEKTKGR